jgi:hypothetical protein
VPQGEEIGVAYVLLVEDRPQGVVAAAVRRPSTLGTARRPSAGRLPGGPALGLGGAEVVAG